MKCLSTYELIQEKTGRSSLPATRWAAAAFLSAALWLQPQVVSAPNASDPADRDSSISRFQYITLAGPMVVLEIHGKAKRSSELAPWTSILTGTTLQAGDRVRTYQATLLLRAPDSSLVKVTPNTELRFSEPAQDRNEFRASEWEEGFVVRSCRGLAEFRLSTDEPWQLVRVNSILPEGAILRIQEGVIVDLVRMWDKKVLRLKGKIETTLAPRDSSAESVSLS